MKTNLHPFEAAGMGTGPYKFLYMWSFPSPALAEANTSAYNAALADMPRDLSGGCGTCRNCGMAIRNVCVVQDAAGVKYGVGSDCVEKTGDACIGEPAKIAVAKHLRDMRRAKAEEKRAIERAAWLAKPCNHRDAKPGETNAEFDARRITEAKTRADAEAAVRKVAADKMAIFLPSLDAQAKPGNFCESIANGIRNGYAPQGRALSIVLDIYAKTFGKRGSAAYNTALDNAAGILNA